MTLILIFDSGLPPSVNAIGARAVRLVQEIQTVAVVAPPSINARVEVVISNPTVVGTEAG